MLAPIADSRKQIFLLAETSAFCRNLEEQFSCRRYRFDWMQSWLETLQHWQFEGCSYRIGIVDLDLISTVEDAAIDALRVTAPRRDLPIFVLKDHRPTPHEMLRYMSEGIVGAILRDAPLEETLYRIEAYLASRGPNHFVRPPRVEFQGTVRVTSLAKPGIPVEISLGCDLSRTGILVDTWHSPEMGEHVRLEFEVPEVRESIQCMGEVRRVVRGDTGPAAMGIAFVDLADSDERMLTQHVLNSLRTTSCGVEEHSL